MFRQGVISPELLLPRLNKCWKIFPSAYLLIPKRVPLLYGLRMCDDDE